MVLGHLRGVLASDDLDATFDTRWPPVTSRSFRADGSAVRPARLRVRDPVGEHGSDPAEAVLIDLPVPVLLGGEGS